MTNTAILTAAKANFKLILTFLKTYSLKTLVYLTPVMIYLAPIKVLIVLIGFAVIIDTVAGRWCAKKLAEKAKKDVRLEVTSKKMRQGMVSKIITYNIAIISLFVLDKYFLNDIVKYFAGDNFPVEFVITKIIGVVFLWMEFDSIDEKYYLVYKKRIKTIIRKKLTSAKGLVFSAKKMNDDIKHKD